MAGDRVLDTIKKSDETDRRENYEKRIMRALVILALFFLLWISGVIGWFFSKNPTMKNFAGVISFVVPFIVLALTVRGTIIPQGFGKALLKMGQLCKIIIELKDHVQLPNGYIVEEEDAAAAGYVPPKRPFRWLWRKLFGGLVIYFYPFFDIDRQLRRWINKRGDSVIAPHEEWLDNIMLVPQLRYGFLPDAEDSNQIPLELLLQFYFTIVNPEKAYYKIDDPLEYMISRTAVPFRKAVAKNPYTQVQKGEIETTTPGQTSTLQDIFLSLKGTDGRTLKEEFFEDAGIDLHEVGISSIDPAEAYRKLTTMKVEAEQQALKVELEVARPFVAITKSMAQVFRMSEEDFAKRMLEDEVFYERVMARAGHIYDNKQAADVGNLWKILGAQGSIEQALYTVLAMLRGGGKGPKSSGAPSSSSAPSSPTSGQGAKDFFSDIEF